MVSLLFRQVNLFYSFCFERDLAFLETLTNAFNYYEVGYL